MAKRRLEGAKRGRCEKDLKGNSRNMRRSEKGPDRNGRMRMYELMFEIIVFTSGISGVQFSSRSL